MRAVLVQEGERCYEDCQKGWQLFYGGISQLAHELLEYEVLDGAFGTILQVAPNMPHFKAAHEISGQGRVLL